MERNSHWWVKDALLTAFAGSEQNVVAIEHPEFTAEENLAEVEKRIKEHLGVGARLDEPIDLTVAESVEL